MANLMRRTLVRTSAPIFKSLRRIVPQVAWATGCAAEQCGAARSAAHRPSRQTTAVAGWRASSPPKCGRRTGRAGTPPLSRGQALDAVFHVAAGAVDLLVQALWLGILAAERGDDKARVGRTCRPFGLGNDAALAAPAVTRRPGELGEPARRLAGGFALLLGRAQFAGNLGDQPLVLGQAKEKLDPVGLAPTHQNIAGKPRIGAQHNTHLRPAGADLGDNARGLLDRPGGRVDVGAAQLCRQQIRPLYMYSGR